MIATTQYCIWASRRRRRAGVTHQNLRSPISYSIVSGSEYRPHNLPIAIPAGYRFGFWSIIGNVEGPLVGYDYENPPLVTAGSNNIAATAWFIPIGEGGDGEIGTYVDAFDVNRGIFVDDDFVNVITSPALSANVNLDGWISTQSSEQLEAYPHVVSLPFIHWKEMNNPLHLSEVGRVLTAPAKAHSIAFAFYHASGTGGFGPLNIPEQAWIFVSPGVKLDAGGFVIGPNGPIPVGPWGALSAKLHSTIAILSLSQNMTDEVRNKAVDLAVSHLDSIANSIRKTQKTKG